MSPANADGMATTSFHHPDLDNEVATLSTKLINAINHQTTLDDTLSATRVELEQSRERVRLLEDQVAQQREMLAGDVWVRRKTVESEKAKLLSRIADEKRLRYGVEEQKKKIEQELENLTAALFEEANKMVVTAKEEARLEHEQLQRRNDQLKAQLADTEGLLKSQQDQLAELKHVMEQMSAERDDQTAITAPSSPGFSKFETTDDGFGSDGGSQSGAVEPVSPSYPTSFTHLLQPVLRTDLSAFDDFRTLVRTSKRLSSNRVSSGSHTGLGALGLGLSAAPSSASAPSNGSTTSLGAAGTPVSGSSPQTPNTPASSTMSPAGSAALPAALPPLKETKFYKRVLAEDIEPTLRLDIAPGLSWLARRSVVNAMTDGSLVVEPAPTPNGPLASIIKPQHYPCSLCGESRRDEAHLRTHRFRTSESDSAQRHPLCGYCLARVRSTCDFLGFLRVVKDGHWRADDDDAERAAWEESVRLREQMFWARIGGGVLPAGHHTQAPTPNAAAAASPRDDKSPRLSRDEPREKKPVAVAREEGDAEAKAGDQGADAATAGSDAVTVAESEGSPDTVSSVRNSTQSLGATSEKGTAQRLSLTIPTSSE